MKRREFLGACSAGAVVPLAKDHEWQEAPIKSSPEPSRPDDEIEQIHSFQLFGIILWFHVVVRKSGLIEVQHEECYHLWGEMDGWYVLDKKHQKAKIRRIDDKTIEIKQLEMGVPWVKPFGTKKQPKEQTKNNDYLRISDPIYAYHSVPPGRYRMTKEGEQ